MTEWFKSVYEESNIDNSALPDEWKTQESLDDLQDFLQYNWEQRDALFSDGKLSSRQQYISFTGNQGLRTNNYIGTIVFKGCKLDIFPKVFRESRNDIDTSSLTIDHMLMNLGKWIEYCNRLIYRYVNLSADLSDVSDLRELYITIYLRYVHQLLEAAPFFQYEDKSETLRVIKGRININDYLAP